ncbi:hypothetical protein [Glycomyces terrestris]|uniref:Uncharacterized protein n=1 Tax=Glycomyces terrestris TaxID=2493553 RepID=A0A426V4I0_9ACTN|nr:hypothetical protein [Glycomyces terrestris]RRS01786.1 hypothetical protein EIW28_03240 [Glycomyces terrestris]
MRLTLRRLLTAAAVLLAAAALTLVPAAPAQAKFGLLFVCDEDPDTGLLYNCHWVPVPELGPKWPPDGCPECGVLIDFWKFDIDPVAHEKFNDLLRQGVDALARSHLTDDAKLADQLRADALAHFRDAAAAVEKYPIALSHSGLWDDKNQKPVPDPSPQPWIADAGAELAAGIGILQADLWDPQPDPPGDAAMRHFDKAYQHLSDLAAQ